MLIDNIILQTNIALINPIHVLNKYDFDVNLYKNIEVLYLICVKNDIYKFGITQNIIKRLKTHKDNFDYEYVLKCWKSINRTVGKKIEDCIKLYIRHSKIDYKLNNETELFKTDNINLVIQVINKYFEKYTKDYTNQFKNAEIEQQNELAKNKAELFKNKLELFKLMKDFECDKNTVYKILDESIKVKSDSIKSADHDNNDKLENCSDIDSKCESDKHSDVCESDEHSEICDSDNDSIFDDFDKSKNNINVVDHNKEAEKEQSQEEKDFNMQTDLRKCQRCKGPHTEEEFGLNKKKKPYKNCFPCREKQIVSDLKRQDDPKRIESKKEGLKKYWDLNRNIINEQKKEEYKKVHPPKVRQTVEERQAKEKEYYAKNKDKILEYKKKFYYGTKPTSQNKEEIEPQLDQIDPVDDIMNSIDKNDLLRQKQNKYYDENASEIIYRKTMRARTMKNNK